VALQLQDNIGEMRQAADTGRKNFDEAIQRIEKESTSKVLVLEKEQKDLGQSLAHLDEPLKRSYGLRVIKAQNETMHQEVGRVKIDHVEAIKKIEKECASKV